MDLEGPVEPRGVVAAVREPAIEQELHTHVSGRHGRARSHSELVESVLTLSHELEEERRAVEGVVDGVVMLDASRHQGSVLEIRPAADHGDEVRQHGPQCERGRVVIAGCEDGVTEEVHRGAEGA